MLFDLSFIASGQPWPPADKDEAARRNEHMLNRKLYSELHEEVLPKFAAYLRDKIDDDKKSVILLGWAEIATDSYLNLLIGEDPDITAPKVYDRPDEEVFIDDSRYGIGLYEIHQDGISAANPENCYLVVQPGNIRKVQAYVFFQEFVGSGKDANKYVKFTIHSAGTIQHLVFDVVGSSKATQPLARDGQTASTSGVLGTVHPLTNFPQFASLQVDTEGKQNTGVPEPLIVRVDNKFTSERYYGQSDYSPVVHSLIEALELAFARRAEVLAKFSRPRPMAGQSAFTFNHSRQKWEWKTDEAILIEPGEPPAQYLTWAASLTDVEVEINGLMDHLLHKLKLSKQLLAGEAAGHADSGTALRIRLIPTLSKIRMFASSLRWAIPQVLSLKSKLDVALTVPDSEAFEPKDVAVVLHDGIPSDPAQEATIALSKSQMIVGLVNAKVLDGKAALRACISLGILDPENFVSGLDQELEGAITETNMNAMAAML
jgi:hypothetical protein